MTIRKRSHRLPAPSGGLEIAVGAIPETEHINDLLSRVHRTADLSVRVLGLDEIFLHLILLLSISAVGVILDLFDRPPDRVLDVALSTDPGIRCAGNYQPALNVFLIGGFFLHL